MNLQLNSLKKFRIRKIYIYPILLFNMGKFHYNKKGYPVWNNSGKSVHRTVAKASPSKVVHHKDGNPHNFRRSNLKVMSRGAHSKLHTKKRRSFW